MPISWKSLSCIGAINRRFEYKGRTSDEWRYYISSWKLMAKELLRCARLEWSIAVV
ncbi:MAG: hypothetical protein FWB78_12385 [Treponema sp.]|nr:hypothetical protein [Treponema sp.]